MGIECETSHPAFPAAAAALYLDQVHFRLDNRFLDRIADLNILALAKADVAVAVTHNDNCTELDTPAGVGHTLHHGDIENFIFQIGKERIDNLGFLDRSAALKDLVDAFDLSRGDELAKTGDRVPLFSFVCHLRHLLFYGICHLFDIFHDIPCILVVCGDMRALGTLIRREDLLAVTGYRDLLRQRLSALQRHVHRGCPVETDVQDCAPLLCFLCFYRKEHAREVCRRCVGG
jgi:hypothetical protein